MHCKTTLVYLTQMCTKSSDFQLMECFYISYKASYNYGKMLLYNAMLMCSIEPPLVITLDDIVLPNKRTGGDVKDWELHGILQCFLEL